MNRLPVGDIAVRAFRKYARLFSESGQLTAFGLYERFRGCCKSDGEALEMVAVHNTLRALRALGKDDCADAVRAVYFACRGRTPRKNEISHRVMRFSRERCMDERTVWRRLDEAKRLYLKLNSVK